MQSNYINSPDPVYKPYKMIGYKDKEPSLLHRHVAWIKADHGCYHLLVKIFKIVEIIFAALSLVCIPLIVKAYKISAQMDAEKKFKEAVALVKPPNSEIKIEFKTDTRTFTHTHEIIIENNLLWGRHRHSGSQWTPIYFDGFMDNRKPVSLHADGANLSVIDDHNDVHYKKLIHEYRSSEITSKNKRAQEFIKDTDVDLHKDSYIVVDKMEKNNWKEKWFTLPVLNLATPLFKLPNKLKLPENYLSAVISHRGRYNDALEDGAGFKHPVEAGVTTLYVLDRLGKIIPKYDPWSPRIAKMNIHVPETSATAFRGIKLDVAASHLMLIGYETTNNPNGEGVVHKLSIKTKLADIDSQGWNPGLKYDYFPNERDSLVRVVDTTPWRDHPLNLKPGEKVTKVISIIQTGEGNDAREMRIEGWNAVGEKGCFYKMVRDLDWNFRPTDDISSEEALDFEMIEEEGVLQTSVFDYEAETVNFKNLNGRIQPTISLKNFGAGSADSTMTLKYGEKTYALLLHRKKTLKNFIGIEGDSYDLVIPAELHNDAFIKKLFHGKKWLAVDVKINKKSLTIKSKDFHIKC
jgi:hypothetical protein